MWEIFKRRLKYSVSNCTVDYILGFDQCLFLGGLSYILWNGINPLYGLVWMFGSLLGALLIVGLICIPVRIITEALLTPIEYFWRKIKNEN
jgi:hypothetical protein